ncbi:Eco57I restriction-modification methylase domain-containing protein [Serinicoccus sp. CUA-874]|uniref:Eco57I restriction-modification methylase domain-containing protein n=1 Tax=Serinicoccus sp. CUA-874 TaxID=1517939 RepID=UPI00192D122F|nr:type IIL restriction-modification enzyme MmeI [Serinicoccus sp. CUA-874]
MADLHEDWLAQVETEGPFLALPVVKDIWPDGVERLGDADDRMTRFKQAFVTWQHEVDSFAYADRTPEAKERYGAVTRAWIDTVLDDLAGWQVLRIPGDELPTALEIRSPGEQVAVRPTAALKGRNTDYGALLLISEPTSSLRDTGLDGWAANEIDRMAMLLRKAQVEVGIVTDGQWWAIVWAKEGKPTGSGTVNALTWAEEPLLRDAFLTLIDQRRFRAKDGEQRLPRLFERSELEAEEITEALGTQVRRSVELLVQAFSEARLAALLVGDPDPLPEDPDEVYQAAVTVMMRVVFLLFAEEREMLPTEQLYWDSYAIRDLLTDLETVVANGEEPLDGSFDVWHRLLAVSRALYGGVNYDEMRMPAYGGSLLDPERFPWLSATDRRGLRLKVSDRVMLHVLQSVQTVVVRRERRRVSFRDVDVEQIGYIYEGLLGYSCEFVEDQVVIGLVGKEGEEPEIDADTLQQLYGETSDAKTFAKALSDWIKEDQPAAKSLTAARLAKLYDAQIDEADVRRLLTPVASHDEDLLGFLIDWSNYIRRDLRGIPLVVPVGGLVVVETPSRKNAGAHYTPRSLAEEVVRYALEPLVYEPGPLQTNDENAWRLKSSSSILDLKVADIAAGSGAFLVAAARYLADRVTEAWIDEGRLEADQLAEPARAKDRAMREVIARCLYGADINPMAVEMCKLSLWLVSMDKTKPFSFVDDKIFCGNSLIGVTSLEQLRQLHVHPESTEGQGQLLVDIDAKIAEATRLREELASPVEEHDPMRSTRGKLALLEQLRRATADLRLIADAIIAAGLPKGFKPGPALDDTYKLLSWEILEAFPAGGANGDPAKLHKRIDSGLTPTVPIDGDRWRPLHWALEVPEVMAQGGFDAVIGNPPFLYGRAIANAVGSNMRSAMINGLVEGVPGVADLCVYFLRRAADLLSEAGLLGYVATNTVTQGPSRVVGLAALLTKGFAVRRCIRSMPWPTKSASVDVSIVWLQNCGTVSLPEVWADGVWVPAVNSQLEPVGRVSGEPLPLSASRGVAFKGSNLNGLGFLMSPGDAARMISENPRNSKVLRPYVTGEDLNSRADHSASRWTVDFNDLPVDEAQSYAGPYSWLQRNLYDYRKGLNNKPRLQQRWYTYESRALSLYQALAESSEAIAMSAVTKHVAPVIVPTGPVFSHGVIVFTHCSHDLLALLASECHVLWAWTHGSNLETRLNYNVASCFETFPPPEKFRQLSGLGRRLEQLRSDILAAREIGLTDLYNLVCSAENKDGDVKDLRDLHEQIDRAVLGCYGWQDLKVEHGFYEYKRVVRWTIDPRSRSELLDRLLELNLTRARAEGQDVPEQTESL